MFGIIPFKTNSSDEKGGSLGNLFNDFFDEDFLSPVKMAGSIGRFSTDIRENENEYLINADLPGVDKKDISLDYKNKHLIIAAKREEEHRDKEDNYIRKERNYGEFSRSFYFDNIQADKINAKFENGVLRITVPKVIKEEEKGTSIEIH